MRDRLVNLTRRQFLGRIAMPMGVGLLFAEVLFCFFCFIDGMDPATSVVCKYKWPHGPVDAVLGWARPVACPAGAWLQQALPGLQDGEGGGAIFRIEDGHVITEEGSEK